MRSKPLLKTTLDPSQIFLVEFSLDLMGCVQHEIDRINADLKRKISTEQNDLKIAMSIPGIEFASAATILAESADKLMLDVSRNMAPSIYGGSWPSCSRLPKRQS